MELRSYFETARGVGVLATSDADGKVNAAIYSRPRFLETDDETIAFVMADRLSHANVDSNPHAAYLFIEEGEGYHGKRLSLTKVKEETDPEKIQAVRQHKLPAEREDPPKKRFLVTFRIDGVRPLAGAE